jgi:hypothetical protein
MATSLFPGNEHERCPSAVFGQILVDDFKKRLGLRDKALLTVDSTQTPWVALCFGILVDCAHQVALTTGVVMNRCAGQPGALSVFGP